MVLSHISRHARVERVYEWDKIFFFLGVWLISDCLCFSVNTIWCYQKYADDGWWDAQTTFHMGSKCDHASISLMTRERHIKLKIWMRMEILYICIEYTLISIPLIIIDYPVSVYINNINIWIIFGLFLILIVISNKCFWMLMQWLQNVGFRSIFFFHCI